LTNSTFEGTELLELGKPDQKQLWGLSHHAGKEAAVGQVNALVSWVG